jgi:2-amino-4-hydroxy-6-hydroxymethyldihydropteridine diphosphokinase
VKDVAYVALGSNLGQREVFLAQARRSIAGLPHTRLLGETIAEETAPIGPVQQGPFLNQMIAIETELSPQQLLRELMRIENEAGRVRAERWGPRTLDLDIVMFERQSANEANLKVPHPELSNRPFWLRELTELRSARVG